MKQRILIGVIITECHVDFQSEIMRGIISQAFRSNCDIAIISPLSNFYADSAHKDTEKSICDLILSQKFDGFLYDRNTFYGEKVHKYIDELLVLSDKPVMLLDSSDHKNFETTSADDCDAFEDITDHLIDVHGLKRIYCLTGPKKAFVAEERLKGYFNSMKKHGLYYDKSYYQYGDFWTESAKNLAEKIISGELERPEAVVCGNDVSAIQLTKSLMAHGIRIPEDIAVTGYDASDDGYRASPSITSYERPNFQLGAEAFRRLYRIITGKLAIKFPMKRALFVLEKAADAKRIVKCAAASKEKKASTADLNRAFFTTICSLISPTPITRIFLPTNLIITLIFFIKCLISEYALRKAISSLHKDNIPISSASGAEMKLKLFLQSQQLKKNAAAANISAPPKFFLISAPKKAIPRHFISRLFIITIISSGISPFLSEKIQWHSEVFTISG